MTTDKPEEVKENKDWQIWEADGFYHAAHVDNVGYIKVSDKKDLDSLIKSYKPVGKDQ